MKETGTLEQLIIKKVTGLPYLRIVAGTGILNEFPKHIHRRLCIGIVTDGTRLMNFNDRHFHYSRNDIFILNPGEPHSCQVQAVTAHSYTVLTIDASRLESFRGFKFHNKINKRDGLQKRFQELLLVLGGEAPVLEKGSAFFSFLDTLESVYASEKIPETTVTGRDRTIRKILEYLDNNHMDKISIEDLSEIAGLSQFHFNRLFCRMTGLSPYAYHLHSRIEYAKHQLLSGGSIVETALDSGFADQSHFTKYFKKIVGVTPGTFIRYNKP